jgi:L-lactate dehydrogenase complex protein LldG
MVGEIQVTDRERLLASIRTSLADVPEDEQPVNVDVPRGGDVTAPVELFVERVREYPGEVQLLKASGVAKAAEEICKTKNIRTLVAPPGVDEGWLPRGDIDVVSAAHLSADELDRVGGVLTGCRLAIAETGTIVLDGSSASGRRAITLVPDVHLCVVLAEQIVGTVPEAVDQLRDAVMRDRVPLTFVSGPSATSDIEFNRVEGVHGPRHLVALLIS